MEGAGSGTTEPGGDPVRPGGDPNDTWRRRRLRTDLVLGFCGLVVGFVLVKGTDSRLFETALVSAFTLAGAVLSVYGLGVVWDDKSRRMTTVGRDRAGS